MNISSSATQAYPMASIGQTLEPYTGFVFIIACIVLFVGCLSLVLGMSKPLLTCVMMAVALFAFISVAHVSNDYEHAQLFDTQGEILGRVASATESGGGCTPVRTAIQFKDGTGLTVPGRLSLTPGDQLFKKVTASGTYICKGDSQTAECDKA